MALLAACAPEPPRPPQILPRLDAIAADGLVVDGSLDTLWERAPELKVPLKPQGEVRLKAAHDGKRLFLLALWNDPAPSQSRFWKYEGDLKWKKSLAEDGFGVMWCPGDLAESFKADGCAITCHDGRHVQQAAPFVDFWYWGAQQCALFPEARDLWLREGDEHRLRGDRQPEDSDNVPNVSDKYDGPKGFPRFRRAGDDRIIPHGGNVSEVTPDWIRQYWKSPDWIGREVPTEFLRARKGSRGDVAAAARWHEKGPLWVLELARDFRTGNTDDIVLGAGPVLLAIAVWNDAGEGGHAVSGPIELRFLTAP